MASMLWNSFVSAWRLCYSMHRYIKRYGIRTARLDLLDCFFERLSVIGLVMSRAEKSIHPVRR